MTRLNERRLQAVILLIVLFGGSGPQALAQDDVASRVQVERGFELARVWCSECHVVEPDGGSDGRTEAPAFDEVANRDRQSVEALETFLTRPHPPMPDLQLSRDQMRNLALYVMSLKGSGE